MIFKQKPLKEVRIGDFLYFLSDKQINTLQNDHTYFIEVTQLHFTLNCFLFITLIDALSNFIKINHSFIDRFSQLISINLQIQGFSQQQFTEQSFTEKIETRATIMSLQRIKLTIKQVLNWQSFLYLTHVYLQCLAYLLPVIIIYFITKNFRTTLYILAIMIITRFFVAVYQIQKSKSRVPKCISYASCYRGSPIDEVQRMNKTTSCFLEYEKIKEQRNKMSEEDVRKKEEEMEEVAEELENMERTIFGKWED